MAYEYEPPSAAVVKRVLTPFNIENLKKLSAKLKVVPEEKFDMRFFFDGPAYETPSSLTVEDYNHCGTSACACGWGPAAGVSAEPRESWNEYAARAFGADPWAKNGIYSYLFDEDQQGSAKMAAARIDTVIRRWES